MRARMALLLINQPIVIREIDLKHKADEFVVLSPKATVPVLQLPDHTLIEESLEIVDYAYQHDLSHCFYQESSEDTVFYHSQLEYFSENILPAVYRYKYPERYDDISQDEQFNIIYKYLEMLDKKITYSYLLGDVISRIDIALFPFVRQISLVDTEVFSGIALSNILNWFDLIKHSELFNKVMTKLPVWQSGDDDLILSLS